MLERVLVPARSAKADEDADAARDADLGEDGFRIVAGATGGTEDRAHGNRVGPDISHDVSP